MADRHYVEINFDGLVGPSHHYEGLSFGNLASQKNAGSVSRPRMAALQGLAKMRAMLSLGLPQGMLLPHPRPHVQWLRQFGFSGDDAQVCAQAVSQAPELFIISTSASAMWTANAATVSPAVDCADGRTHISVANLARMRHRSLEADETLMQLRAAFADKQYFAVHPPLPWQYGDEGAANHMRMAQHHSAAGLEIFVYGVDRGQFPARQHMHSSQAIALRHGLDPARTLIVEQAPQAIEAGAFHNDVVAVANEHVLLMHEEAFVDKDAVVEKIHSFLPEAEIIIAPADRISLDMAVKSYLFNSQLVSLPGGGMALVAPQEVREESRVWLWLEEAVARSQSIERILTFDVHESMRNGGGPACLRLRVAVPQAAYDAIDARYLLNMPKLDKLMRLVEQYWPDSVTSSDLDNSEYWRSCWAARQAILDYLAL